MAIQFKEVSFSYRGVKDQQYEAIKDINLQIDKGEFIAVCGQTGSGKTTMVQHMNALLQPTRGNVFIFEHTLPQKKKQKIGPIRKRVGLVFQFPEYQLFEETILKDIMFGPKNFGLSNEEAKEKALMAAKLVGLSEDLLEKSPFRISGGQMRRVAIAGILAMEPDILVLDEPTRGLDPQGSKEIMDLFYKLHKENDKTIILVSHDMDIIANYASRVVVLDEGQIVFDGSKEDLFSHKDFDSFHLAKPKTIEVMHYLNEQVGIPFKNLFSFEDVLAYLKEVSK